MQHPESPRVLWVTDEPINRALSGGSIRQSHLFEALAAAFPTDLLIAGESPDQPARDAANEVFELPVQRGVWTEHPIGRRALSLAIALGYPYPLPVYRSSATRRAIAQAIRERHDRYDVVLIEHEVLAPLLPRSRSARWIITFHHLLSGMINSDIDLAPGKRQRWFRQRDVRKALALERRAVQRFDHCVVCSPDDAAALAAADCGRHTHRITVIPNGVDLSRFGAGPVPPEPTVLFPGNLAFPPNVDGAIWFCSEIWPRVRAAAPEASLMLVGRKPTDEVRALAELPGVSVHADVPSMVPYFQSARVVVVPLRLGTGTRLKALEAMGAGRPVVGTTVGLGGIGVIDGVQARLADDVDAFTAAVVEVLEQDDIAESLGRAGRAHVTGEFEWDRIEARFVAMVSELAESPTRRMTAPGAV